MQFCINRLLTPLPLYIADMTVDGVRIGESSYSVCPSVCDVQRGVHPSVKNMVVLSGAQTQVPFAQLDGRRGQGWPRDGHRELQLVIVSVGGYCRISEAPGNLSLLSLSPPSSPLSLDVRILLKIQTFDTE